MGNPVAGFGDKHEENTIHLNQKLPPLTLMKSKISEWWSNPIFRVVGYALLALSFFDIVNIFVPARFGDPVWEFQIATNLVERVPVPLLGLVLVFGGEASLRIFRLLSWACLVAGLLFLLLVPLSISSAWRINQQNQQQFTTQLTRQTAQVERLKAQLNKATTAQELSNVLTRLNPQSRIPPINNPQQVKNQLLAEISQAEGRVQTKAEASRANANLLLLKNATKAILGALVSGFVFLSIWYQIRKIAKSKPAR